MSILHPAPPLPSERRSLPPLPAINGNPTHTLQINLEGMPISELLALRNQVEQRLPAKDLKDLDLSRELVLQVLALQQLQNTVLNDPDTPANQQAQCAGALSTALVNLVKLQIDVQNSERLKKIEAALIETIKEKPTEFQEAFFAAYETRLTAA